MRKRQRLDFLHNHCLSKKPTTNFGVIPAHDAEIEKKRNMDPSVSYLDDRKIGTGMTRESYLSAMSFQH
ncbi:hypothetical protein COM42_001050, partial [Wolbachia pipientis]